MRRAWVAFAAVVVAAVVQAAPQGTGFTYQGQLKQNGTPVDEPVNFQFRLWDDSVAGTQVAPPVTRNGVPVQDGVFTVEIDFGSAPYGTEQRWIEVIANNVPLTPRQPVTVTPMAIYALSGLPGPQGIQGVQGLQGIPGPAGSQGPPGTDGVPLVFGGSAHESPNRLTGATASYAAPLGISPVVSLILRAQALVPAPCVAGSLRVRFTSNNASYVSTTATLMVNGIETGLACAVTQAGVGTGSCQDLVDTVALAAGDTIALRFTPPFPTRPVGNVESRTGVFANFGFLCSAPP